MSVFSFVGCLIDRHNPVRRKVVWDGRNHVGHCRHCGAEIQRHGHRNWRRLSAE